ncbi:MAG: carbohydrate binding family 9 domain-containing protein [Pyrinomonadaceae bacterium]|nr:carbohydrate binding family 9 domain-containing protein [Pyrinomonadaceae bacterium]
MYDTKHLYIAFKCWDEKDKIRATVAKRDSVFGEDNVRVWLDTYNDQRRAYVLGWNPLGIQADGIYTEGQGNDFSVDIVMESKGMIHEWGWSVEVKIPFKSLRYSAGKGKMWGFNAARNIDRLNDEFDSWMPNDRNISGSLIQHGKITGLNEIKTERTLELVPSVTISETGKRVPANEVAAGRFVNESIKQEYGLNIKYTITPNVTLDAAINPDFAEIEADAPVVTANQRFPIFFREKRPFFLEGAEIFQSPIRVFHSRTIVDPDYAAKLTGKVGKNSFGFLVASDNAPGNFDNDSRIDPEVRPFIDEFVDENALFSVLRLKRDFGKENNIGFFGTARVFPENRNFLGGFDGSIKLNPKTSLSFQAVGSHSRKCFFDPKFDDIANPGQAQRNGEICGGAIVNGVQELGSVYQNYRTGNGLAYELNINSSGNTSGYWIGAGGQSEDYRSDVGFNRRTNTNFAFFGFRRSTKSKPKNRIIRANWNNNFNLSYDWQGRLQNTNYNTNINLSFQKNTFINFWGGLEKEVLYEEEFGLVRNSNRNGAFFGDATRSAIQPFFGTFFRTQPSKKFSIATEFGLTFNSFDFDFGAGTRFPRISPAALADPDAALDPGAGRRLFFYTEAELALTDPWRFSVSYRKSKLDRNDTGRTAFNVNIYSLRSTYQFTRFIFARARIDYNTLRSNINGQYLFGWAPSPGKAFYLGYNDNLNYDGFNPYTGDHEPGFARNQRTFFIRVSYLFRKSF